MLSATITHAAILTVDSATVSPAATAGTPQVFEDGTGSDPPYEFSSITIDSVQYSNLEGGTAPGTSSAF